jgi:hypothetical protein
MSSKGGSTNQWTDIPDWVKDPTVRNIARAEDVQNIGYMPWQGPDIAAINPNQQAAMQANIGAAEAFGLMPTGSLTPMQGMPAPTTYADGTQGYSGMPLFEQAKADLAASQPGDVAKYDALYS